MNELIGNLVTVCMSSLHDATKDSPSPIFPNGIVNGENKYTPEAEKKYNQLFSIYKDIIDESNL